MRTSTQTLLCAGLLWLVGGLSCDEGVGTGPLDITALDAAQDIVLPETCPPDRVATVQGCLTCTEAADRVQEGRDEAWEAYGPCATAGDCVFTSADTECSGTCPMPINATQEQAFRVYLDALSGRYCSDYATVCGYATPSCAAGDAACQSGRCVFVQTRP